MSQAGSRPPTARYCPEFFEASDVERAKEIILTPEGPGADTNSRWARETPYLVELIGDVLPIRSDMTVLDYGCGIGRLAKALIESCGCSVVGVDISRSMLDLAVHYVASDRFQPMTPEAFDAAVEGGFRTQAALAIWVLQHCFAPQHDIARIHRGLVDGGNGFVLNMPKRAVPATRDTGEFFWAPDGIDVAALLRAAFQVRMTGVPNPARTPNMADAGAYWMLLQRHG